MIFVFGSNLGGRHGAGAALYALQHYGAKSGIGVGLWGRSYAIPTKDCHFKPLPLEIIKLYIAQFLQQGYIHALAQSTTKFKVTRIGCGLAGYRDQDIAPAFQSAPKNCTFDEAWKPWLGPMHTYWGTYTDEQT